MFIHRCPWCGKRIFWLWSNASLQFGRTIGINLRKNKTYCTHCRNDFKQAPHAIIKGICISLLVLVPVFAMLFPACAKTAMLFPLLLALWFTMHVPFQRDSKDGKIIEKKSKQVSAIITWQPTKNKGLMKPRYQVLNHEIFPAYFFQGDNLLNGDGICVSLQELSWSSPLECSCKIQLVLNEADDTLLMTSNYFFLYHGKRRIAKGQIK